MTYCHPHSSLGRPPQKFQHQSTLASHVQSYPTTHPELPKIGETRCYWSLLAYPSLSFAYVDPVLHHHLEEQAPLIIGHNVLDFVHPDDQSSVRRDIGSVLETGNMYGSETRVRFKRLSRVRMHLASSTSPTNQSPSTNPYPWVNQAWVAAVTLDDQWMPVNLVISRPTPSAILCFIHAAADIDAGADNDPSSGAITVDGQRRRGWSNWCGTGPLGSPELRDIWSALNRIEKLCPEQALASISQPLKFQILSNSPSAHKDVLISWPPDSDPSPDQNSGEMMAQEFAKLAANVINNDGSVNTARTSCTKRYHGRKTTLNSQGDKIDVESVYIPHGAIIFACHKVVALTPPSQNQESSTKHANTMLAYPSPASSHFAMNRTPSMSTESQDHHYMPDAQGSNYSTPYSYQQFPLHGGSRWGNEYPPSSLTPNHNSSPWNNERSHPYVPSWPTQAATPVMAYGRMSPEQYTSYPGIPTPISDTNDQTKAEDIDSAPTPPINKKKRRSSGSRTSLDDDSAIGSLSAPARGTSLETPRPTKQRNHSRPPGLLQCTICSATNSPEWRKGPSGKKELCNACGLRFARSKAKNEGKGVTKASKKKTKLSPPLKHQPKQEHPSTSPELKPASPVPSPTTAIPQIHHYTPTHQSGQYSHPYPAHQDAYYSAAASLASLSNGGGHYYPYNGSQGGVGAYKRESKERELVHGVKHEEVGDPRVYDDPRHQPAAG